MGEEGSALCNDDARGRLFRPMSAGAAFRAAVGPNLQVRAEWEVSDHDGVTNVIHVAVARLDSVRVHLVT
jgi:hypothetical protein